MSTSTSQPQSQPEVREKEVSISEWEKCKPKTIVEESTMSPTKVKAAWDKLYKLVSKGSRDEKLQREIRAAVYVYGCLNGTSRVGNYTTDITTTSGITFPAAHIPAVAGLEVRRFFRANMEESYTFFKATKVMEEYPKFITKCAMKGIVAENAFATADWFSECHLFTPAEEAAHNASQTYALKRAAAARGGRTLEHSTNERLDDQIDAQVASNLPTQGQGKQVNW